MTSRIMQAPFQSPLPLDSARNKIRPTGIEPDGGGVDFEPEPKGNPPAPKSDEFKNESAKPQAKVKKLIIPEPAGDAPPPPQKLDSRIRVTSNDDDPYARPSRVNVLPRSDFKLDASGKPVGLEGPNVKIIREDVIYAENEAGDFEPVATNPFLLAKPNANGDFVVEGEPRFPAHDVEVNEKGEPVLVKGKGEVNGKPVEAMVQNWIHPQIFAGQLTAFEAANTVKHAVEKWAGLPLQWGKNGQIQIQPHAFVGFNAFYSGGDGNLYFGVVPYLRTPEEGPRLFETASSWEIGAHESGHALHHELKPFAFPLDKGFRAWGESIGDQTAMWVGLTDPERAAEVLAEAGGDMKQSTAVSQLVEALAAMQGEGVAMRDAFHQKTVGRTYDEEHSRSEVLTGASYKVFGRIFEDLMSAGGLSPVEAVQQAADMMGQLMVHVTRYVPENSVTGEDVAMGVLKADAELFGGRYTQMWAEELVGREAATVPEDPEAQDQIALFPTESTLEKFVKHEQSLPQLRLPPGKSSREAIDALIQSNLSELGIGPKFGLKLQSRQVAADGAQLVRVQLTEGRGPDAKSIGNHGLLVFRRDGTLADWHGPMPKELSDERALGLLAEARRRGLDQKGTLSLVPTYGPPKEADEPGGRDWPGIYYVDVKVFRNEGSGLNSAVRVYGVNDEVGKRITFAQLAAEDCGFDEHPIEQA